MLQKLSLFFTVLLLLFMSCPAHAITTSGTLTSNEVWNGEVILTGDVTVPNGITLTIEPGTRILVAAGSDDTAGGQDSTKTELIVHGKLTAVGTPDSRIIFTANSQTPAPGDWGGIQVQRNTDEQFRLEQCEIEYTIAGLKYEAQSGNHNISILNCAFRHASEEGLHIHGQSGSQITVAIRGNEGSYNGLAGIYLGVTGSDTKVTGTIENNVAYANGIGAPWNISGGIFMTVDNSAEADFSINANSLIDNEYYGMVFFGGSAYPDQKHCRMVIKGNTVNNGIEGIACDISNNYEVTLEVTENKVVNCTNTGINCGGESTSSVFCGNISDNMVTDCWNGISIYNGLPDSKITLSGNIVSKNQVGISLSGGSNSQTKITENLVTQNGCGIDCQGAGNFCISDNSVRNNLGSGINCSLFQGDFTLLNNKAYSNKYGITCNLLSGPCNTEIKGNVAGFNAKRGIQTRFYGNYNQLDLRIISNNVCENGDNGIDCGTIYSNYPEANLTIEDNQIRANGNRGINCVIPAMAKIVCNDIRENGAEGIYFSAWPGSVLNYSNIIGNKGYYEIMSGSKSLDIQFNYWGEKLTSEMATGGNPKDISRIFDQFDDPSKGALDYANWLSIASVVRPAILSAVSQNGSAYLKWTPVLTASGYKLHCGTSSDTYEQTIDLGNRSDFVLRELINDTTYFLTLTAYDVNGNSSELSDPAVVTPTASAGSIASLSFDKDFYNAGMPLLTLIDQDLIAGSANPAKVHVKSCSDYKGFDLDLSGSADSGTFQSEITLTLDKSDPLTKCLKVADGDFIIVVYSNNNPLETKRANAIVDLSAPITTLVPSAEFYFDGDSYYASKQVFYSLTSRDLYSGIAKIQYQIDGAELQDYAQPFKLTVPGEHVVTFKALDKAGNWEGAKNVKITVEGTVPLSPGGVAATLTDSQVDLSWLPSSEADIRGYYVYRNGLRITQIPISGTVYSDVVNSGTKYSYNITAVDLAGNESPFSKTVSVTTPSAAPLIEISGIDGLVTESEISISGTTDPLAAVEVFINGISQGTTISNMEGRFCFNLTAFDGENTVTVVAVNSYGTQAPPSNTVKFYADPRPAAPIGLTGVPGDTVATIKWQPNSESDIKGYVVYRDGIRLNYNLLPNAEFQDMLLSDGQEYVYTVTAVDQRGTEGKISAPFKLVPIAGPEWGIQ